jgi:signal transduction histidine kinase
MATIKSILKKIESKKSDYEHYNFTTLENDAFKTFFDLAQEIDEIDDFYRLCVAVPMGFFSLHSRLFVISPRTDRLTLVASTEEGKKGLETGLKPSEKPYKTENNSLVLTVRGKELFVEQLPFKTTDGVLGVLEAYPADGLNEHHELFFEKYANRIGYNLHNRFILQKNIEHLEFIRTLVMDIEHNVITPNMVYKLYLRNLKGKITKNKQIEALLSEHLSRGRPSLADMEYFLSELSEVNADLNTELENMERHHKNMSLFLETLFRRGHFDHGRLMLRTQKCNIKKNVLEPQLEQYKERFERMGIEIEDRMGGVSDEDVISVVDVGLIAQVYANLLSNALKYAQPVTLETGETRKFISYGREIIKDYFGPGKDGVKYNLFSSGPHINPDEAGRIFEEGFRGGDTMERPGTGHGLAFVKNVLELHKGRTGYEATLYGNNFYFILPL